MTRAQWYVLRFLAFHWRLGWRALPPNTRRTWGWVAMAMRVQSLHVKQLDWDLPGRRPAWVPCRACGGTPCAWTGHVQERLDRYV